MVALSERVTVLRNNAGEFFIIIVNPVIAVLELNGRPLVQNE